VSPLSSECHNEKFAASAGTPPMNRAVEEAHQSADAEERPIPSPPVSPLKPKPTASPFLRSASLVVSCITFICILLPPTFLLLPRHAFLSRTDFYNPPPPSSKVFGIGMYKTGTTSLALALHILGYSSAQYEEQIGRDGLLYNATTTTYCAVPGVEDLDPRHMARFVRGSPAWPGLVATARRATAFADGPWLFMFREFDELFAGSKFVLTLREGGAEAAARSDMAMWRRLGMMEDKFREEEEEEIVAGLVERYRGHVRRVRKYFAGRDDLLEITFAENESEENWRILVDFLHGEGMPIPKVPFPFKNSKGSGF